MPELTPAASVCMYIRMFKVTLACMAVSHVFCGVINHAVTCLQEVIVADMAPDESEEAVVHDDNVMLDWKGDPMQINPGDRLPFNFK